MAAALHYRLRCRTCGMELEDDGFQLECPASHRRGLLTTRYAERKLIPEDRRPGIYRYRQWLPVRTVLAGSGVPATYRSERLARLLGLAELWIAFNGFWPERGATLATGTFKELEAYAVLGRVPAQSDRILVVASAGNTAAAFAQAAQTGWIERKECVLLNVTGGGRRRRAATVKREPPKADLVIHPSQMFSEGVQERIAALMS
jgi:threonine synthase